MFDKVRQGDKIISTLDESEASKFLNIQAQHDEFDYFRRKMIRAHNKFQALQVLFWEDMMGKHEMCETAAYRGKILSTCKLDDKFVVVERPIELAMEDDDDEDGGEMLGG